MAKCWQKNPDGRPTFTVLRNELKEMENQHKVKYRGLNFENVNISVLKQHKECHLSGVIVNQARRTAAVSIDCKVKAAIITSV